MNAKTVVYYDSELDGYLAAYAVKLSYGEHAKYVPLRPGEKPPVSPNLDLIVLDVPLTPEDVKALLDGAASGSVLVIDHSPAAQAAAAAYPRAYCYDRQHATCVLAWQRFRSAQRMPELYKAVEGYDLGTNTPDHCLLINAAARSYSYPDENFLIAEMLCNSYGKLLADGEPIMRHMAKHNGISPLTGKPELYPLPPKPVPKPEPKRRKE